MSSGLTGARKPVVEGRRGGGSSGRAGGAGTAGSSSAVPPPGQPPELDQQASGGANDPLEPLAGVYCALGSSDWSTRKEGVTRLLGFTQEHGETMCARGKLLAVFDHLTPRLTDPNSKVNVVALQSLQAMAPSLREGLPAVASTLVPALATSLASSNAQVRAITPAVLDALLTEVDHAALIQPFASCVLYSPPKARPVMIDKLRELHRMCSTRPSQPVSASLSQSCIEFP